MLSIYGPSVPVVTSFNVLVPVFMGTWMFFSPQVVTLPVASNGRSLITFVPFKYKSRFVVPVCKAYLILIFLVPVLPITILFH
ncbi:hypothetical protein D3C71_1363710 [compost metagenome]